MLQVKLLLAAKIMQKYGILSKALTMDNGQWTVDNYSIMLKTLTDESG